MEGKRSISIWQIFRLIFHAAFTVLCVGLLLRFLLRFNFEELDILEFLKAFISLVCMMPLMLYSSERVEVDMERLLLHSKFLITRRTTIPFESITSYIYNPTHESVAVFTDRLNRRITVKHEPAFLAWLQEHKTEQATAEASLKGLVIFGVLFLGIVLFIVNAETINTSIKQKIPQQSIETVELSGTFLSWHSYGLSEDGAYDAACFEMQEYPWVRFKASSFLPDLTPKISYLEWKGTKLSLVVNKSDYNLLLNFKPLALLKGSVRVYGVRTDQEEFLRKDITFLKKRK